MFGGRRKCVRDPSQPRRLSLLLCKTSALLPAVTLHYLPKCLYLDYETLFVYLSLVLAGFLVRAQGGSLICWTKSSDTTQGIEMCVPNKLSPKSFILTGKELLLNEQYVYQIRSQKDSFLCVLCAGSRARAFFFNVAEFQFTLGIG